MAKVAGTAYFKVNGTQYSVKGTIKMSLGNKVYEEVLGSDDVHGFKQIPKAPYIECDLTDKPDIDLNMLQELANATITVELINGKVGILRNAYQTNQLELSTEDGMFTVKFVGESGEYVK